MHEMEFLPENAVFGLPHRRGGGPLERLRIAALALVLALSPACDGGDAAERQPDPVTVEVMRIEPELLVDMATFSGQLDAENSVVIKPEIEGVIESIDFDEGQTVARGDVLFRIASREQKARLREAQATRDLAGDRWKRAQQLLSRDASSRDQADLAHAEYEIAKARVDLAKLELDRTEVRAPFDGVVGLHLVDLGARVDDETELVRIDSVERLQVSFAITDVGLPFARTGMTVNAWVRPYPGEKFPGEVFFVSPTLDPRNRRILVKAWIDNSDRRLAPGLFANVDLEIRRVEQALVVPESAVAIDQQGSYVWVIDEARTASRRPIEIGLRERGIVEVIQGLSPGVEIVTAGTHKVSDGELVRVSESPLVGRARGTPPEGSIIGEGT